MATSRSTPELSTFRLVSSVQYDKDNIDLERRLAHLELECQVFCKGIEFRKRLIEEKAVSKPTGKLNSLGGKGNLQQNVAQNNYCLPHKQHRFLKARALMAKEKAKGRELGNKIGDRENHTFNKLGKQHARYIEDAAEQNEMKDHLQREKMGPISYTSYRERIACKALHSKLY